MNRLLIVGMAALCLSTAHAANVGEALDPATLNALKVDPAKITVIDFFAQWCISCRKELPLISALHARIDPKRVEFIGVDTDDSLDTAQAFQKELRDKGMLGFRVINDNDQALVKGFKPKGYPALYLLKDGKVVREHLGATPNIDALLEQDLRALGAN